MLVGPAKNKPGGGVVGRPIAVAVFSAALFLALPLWFSWSVPYLVDANFLGTTFAGMVLVARSSWWRH